MTLEPVRVISMATLAADGTDVHATVVVPVKVARMRKEGRPRRAAHTGLMRRLGIVIIVFLLGCSFRSGATQEASLARGRDLLKHGSYKEAIAVFTALADKNS